MYAKGRGHQLGMWGVSSSLTLSTGREHQIPQVKGSNRPVGPPLQTPVASPGCYLCFSVTHQQLEVPTTPSNSEHQPQVQKVTCTSDLWLAIYQSFPQLPPLRFARMALRTQRNIFRFPVYYKRIVKDTEDDHPDGRQCVGQGVRKRLRGPILSQHHSLHIRVFTGPEALQVLSFWMFPEAVLHKHDWLNHWPLVNDSIPSLSLSRLDLGLESSSALITWFSWLPAPTLGWDPKVTFPEAFSGTKHVTKYYRIAIIAQEIPKVLEDVS